MQSIVIRFSRDLYQKLMNTYLLNRSWGLQLCTCDLNTVLGLVCTSMNTRDIFSDVHYHIFQNPHRKYMYQHFSSNHPQRIFSGIIKTETKQYSRLSRTIEDCNHIHNTFRLRLKALDYPDKVITDNSFLWLPFTTHKRCNRPQ